MKVFSKIAFEKWRKNYSLSQDMGAWVDKNDGYQVINGNIIHPERLPNQYLSSSPAWLVEIDSKVNDPEINKLYIERELLRAELNSTKDSKVYRETSQMVDKLTIDIKKLEVEYDNIQCKEV